MNDDQLRIFRDFNGVMGWPSDGRPGRPSRHVGPHSNDGVGDMGSGYAGGINPAEPFEVPQVPEPKQQVVESNRYQR